MCSTEHKCAAVASTFRKVCVSVPAMAGNIIPAIATTNAIIAGLIVLESLKILSGQIESCRTVGSVTPASTPALEPGTVFKLLQLPRRILSYFRLFLKIFFSLNFYKISNVSQHFC